MLLFISPGATAIARVTGPSKAAPGLLYSFKKLHFRKKQK